MKECFIEKRFNASSRAVIDHANLIIAEHQAEGYILTLRQLYYQFVQRKLIVNKMSEYKRIGSIVNDARLAGLIDWDAIEDRTRIIREIPYYSDPGTFLSHQVSNYAEDLWCQQDYYCEVWVEKDALIGIVERPCVEYRVPFFACRGYASQSGLYEAGRRLAAKIADHRKVVIFHLGDHDPSGLDMTRDNDDRLNMFARTMADVKVIRLGLNMDQIKQFNLPPDPAKLTDSRSDSYTQIYGDVSWELDALAPREIERIITSSIDGIMNKQRFINALNGEQESRKKLKIVSSNWKQIVRNL